MNLFTLSLAIIFFVSFHTFTGQFCFVLRHFLEKHYLLDTICYTFIHIQKCNISNTLIYYISRLMHMAIAIQEGIIIIIIIIILYYIILYYCCCYYWLKKYIFLGNVMLI